MVRHQMPDKVKHLFCEECDFEEPLFYGITDKKELAAFCAKCGYIQRLPI